MRCLKVQGWGALCVALLLGPVQASAARSIAVVVTGDCRDPDLITASRDLGRSLGNAPELSLVSEAEVVERLGRSPTRSIEELRRQLDTAQQQYYHAQYHKAVAQLESALQEIARLPPGEARWQLWVSGSVLDGLIRGRLNKSAAATDAFRRVLRIDPTHTLDPDYFGPSTLKDFDRIRAEVKAGTKVPLSVKTTPPGATVFVDGKELGKTPMRREVLPGQYQVVVGDGGVFSLPRDVQVNGAEELVIDLRFESAIDTERAPCIANPGSEGALLAHAVKFGSLLDIDQLVVLRFERQQVGPSWLAAALVGVKGGDKIREGGIQATSRGYPPQAIEELARFITTGESSANVVAQRPGTPKQSPPAARVEPARPPPVPPIQSVAVPHPGATEGGVTAAAPPSSVRRTVGMISAGFGALALVAGVGFQVTAVQSQNEFQGWVDAGRQPDQLQQAAAARDRARDHQTVAFVAYGVGAVAVGAGLFLWLGEGDESAQGAAEAQVFASPSADGMSVVVRGTF